MNAKIFFRTSGYAVSQGFSFDFAYNYRNNYSKLTSNVFCLDQLFQQKLLFYSDGLIVFLFIFILIFINKRLRCLRTLLK